MSSQAAPNAGRRAQCKGALKNPSEHSIKGGNGETKFPKVPHFSQHSSFRPALLPADSADRIVVDVLVQRVSRRICSKEFCAQCSLGDPCDVP